MNEVNQVIAPRMIITEVLSSDEDEITDETDDYLETLQERVTKKKASAAFNISCEIKVSHHGVTVLTVG